MRIRLRRRRSLPRIRPGQVYEHGDPAPLGEFRDCLNLRRIGVGKHNQDVKRFKILRVSFRGCRQHPECNVVAGHQVERFVRRVVVARQNGDARRNFQGFVAPGERIKLQVHLHLPPIFQRFCVAPRQCPLLVLRDFQKQVRVKCACFGYSQRVVARAWSLLLLQRIRQVPGKGVERRLVWVEGPREAHQRQVRIHPRLRSGAGHLQNSIPLEHQPPFHVRLFSSRVEHQNPKLRSCVLHFLEHALCSGSLSGRQSQNDARDGCVPNRLCDGRQRSRRRLHVAAITLFAGRFKQALRIFIPGNYDVAHPQCFC